MNKMNDEPIRKKAGAGICLSLILSSLIMLSACGPLPKDYDAMAKCGDRGLKLGTEEYDTCVQEETRANMLERHRAEMERRDDQERQQQIYRRF